MRRGSVRKLAGRKNDASRRDRRVAVIPGKLTDVLELRELDLHIIPIRIHRACRNVGSDKHHFKEVRRNDPKRLCFRKHRKAQVADIRSPMVELRMDQSGTVTCKAETADSRLTAKGT